MAQVEFHTGVADPPVFACRLVRKAYRQGVPLALWAPSAMLGDVDRLLWTFDERDFVPHLRLGASVPDPADWQRTPVWLLPEHGRPPLPVPSVQVNLGAELAPDLPQCDRLIEVVGHDPELVQAARQRWRRYQASGHAVIHHGAEAGS